MHFCPICNVPCDCDGVPIEDNSPTPAGCRHVCEEDEEERMHDEPHGSIHQPEGWQASI